MADLPSISRNAVTRLKDFRLDSAARRQLHAQGLDTWKGIARTEVCVHFSDMPVNLYQIRQWLHPFEALSEQMPVTLLTRRAASAEALSAETKLPLVYLRRPDAVESFLAEHDPRVIFYVNHNPLNLSMMARGRAMHVFLSHGESEKSYMTWGQVRAYDFHLVAGQAARDRLRRNLPNYDVETRTRIIGRPQLDFVPEDRSASQEPRSVLYAPTYEGDRPSMRYGSIESHGMQIVRSLVESGFHVIYRAHPRTGANDHAYGLAHQRICAYLETVNKALPAGARPHEVDSAGQIDEQIARAAVGISDNSAMALDFLATGKPTIVTVATAPSAANTDSGYVNSCYRIRVAEADRTGALVSSILKEDSMQEERSRWIEHHFSDTTRGVALQRFIEATREIADYGSDCIAALEEVP